MKKRIILFFALLLIAVFALGGVIEKRDFIDAGAEYVLKLPSLMPLIMALGRKSPHSYKY